MVAFRYQNGGYKKEGGNLVSRFCCNRKGGNGFKIREETLIGYKRQVFYEKSGEALEEVAQKSGGYAVLENIQRQIGQGSDKPDLVVDVPE